jgi:formate-dependent nitrite reductase membrane component NrfD
MHKKTVSAYVMAQPLWIIVVSVAVIVHHVQIVLVRHTEMPWKMNVVNAKAITPLVQIVLVRPMVTL